VPEQAQPEETQLGTPFEMVVEVGKIREFARATKSTNPDYLKGDTPVSPVTFLVSSHFWEDPDHPAVLPAFTSYERVLHGAQEFIFYGEPPRAGTRLTVQARNGPTYEKTGRRGGVMKFAEMITEYRDEHGTLVAEARGTAIETSQPPSAGDGA
jgi:N-terminal half of MaoC dehydratase